VPVEDAHRVGVVDCGGEGLQVAFVGGPADLVVAVKVRHSFSHRAPDAVPVLDPQDAEGGGVVDGGLDPKHVGLVVAFDRVAGHGVLDSPPFGAAPGGAGHLAGELRGELSPEEAQHVLGTEGGGGVREQAGQDGLEGAAGGEGDVGGDLGLVHDPPVRPVASPAQHRQVGVHLTGQTVEEARPAAGGPSAGQALRDGPVGDGDDGVEVSAVVDPLGAQGGGQRFFGSCDQSVGALTCP